MTDSTDNARGPERICDWCDETTPQRKARCPVKGCDRRADLAPDPLGAVRVRPLVWEYHPAGAIAAPPTGFAYIIDTRMKGRVYSLKGFNPQREFSSMDEAKAAAQADYETRIRSALELCDPQDERVAALRGCASMVFLHMSSRDGVCTIPLWVADDLRAALADLSPTGGNDG